MAFKVGFEVYDPPAPLRRPLDDWFDAKFIVRGESICIRIDNELVFQREHFLQIPTGKVGFRNSGAEEALVKDVRVILQP